MSVNIYNNGHLEKASGNGYSKVDPSLSTLSVNAVQNKVVSEKIEEVESSVSENTAFKNGMLTSIEEITASQNQTTSPVAASAVAQLNQSLDAWQNVSFTASNSNVECSNARSFILINETLKLAFINIIVTKDTNIGIHDIINVSKNLGSEQKYTIAYSSIDGTNVNRATIAGANISVQNKGTSNYIISCLISIAR